MKKIPRFTPRNGPGIAAKCLALAAVVLPTSGFASDPPTLPDGKESRPNFVFIITDDVERSMLNALPEGRGLNLTPHIDRLVNEGTIMEGQHVASAVCTPSRYNVLTGNYASRALAIGEQEQAVVAFTTHIRPDQVTLPMLLQKAGYRTAMVGKNHVVEAPPLPNIPLEADPRDPAVAAALREFQPAYEAALCRAGFDFVGGIYPANPDELLPRALRVHNMDYVTEGALRFLDEQTGEKPFFLYLATTLPHGPVVAERSWNSDPLATPFGMLEEPLSVLPARTSIPERLAAVGLASDQDQNDAAMMLAVDDAIGAILDRLESRQLLGNTVVVFFNDHGCDTKGTLYQGGLAFPSVFWRAGGFPVGSRSKALVSNVDFAPTLLDLAGVDFDTDQFDGISFQEVLMGGASPDSRILYSEMGFSRALRVGDWKYLAIRYPEDIASMDLEERRCRLEEWNAHLRERGIEPLTTDPMAPFSHLTAIPGGAHAEHSSTGKKNHYYDPDQLFNLAEDPGENFNLANDPQYADLLASMQEILRQKLRELPGTFGEFTSP